jgi:hypothetical protein
MTFYFFKCSISPAVYLITDKPVVPDNVDDNRCAYGYWVFDKGMSLNENKNKNFDFSEELVRKDIAANGYSFVHWKPREREDLRRSKEDK